MWAEVEQMIDHTRSAGFRSRAEIARLGEVEIGIAGCGGIGNELAKSLVMSGVTKVRLADPEFYTSSNTDRVSGATHKAVLAQQNKAEGTAEELLQINPDVEVKVYTDGITEDNVEEFTHGLNHIIDGIEFRRLAPGYLLSQHAIKNCVSNQYGLNLGFGGAVTTFNPNAKRFTYNHAMGIPDGMPLNEVEDLENDMGRIIPGLPIYGDIRTLQGVKEGGPLPTTREGVLTAAAIGTTEAFLNIIGGKKAGNRRHNPTIYPRWNESDPYMKSAGLRMNLLQVRYYRTLGQGVIRNILGINPKCDYDKNHTD